MTEMLERERAGVILEPNIGEHGTLFVTGRDGGSDSLPSVVLAAEHYNLIVRMIEQGIPARLAVNIEGRYHTDDTNAYHVIAEIPGTDPEIGDEVVMVGAHLDSWHSGTGATDNADGCSIAMEAMRILVALGVEPRRDDPHRRCGVVKNRVSSARASTFGNISRAKRTRRLTTSSPSTSTSTTATRPSTVFSWKGTRKRATSWRPTWNHSTTSGATIATLQGVGSTDHLSFIRAGLPGFQAIHDYTDYDVRTHHTNVDTFERVDGEDLKQAAIVMASILYHAAMREGKIPRAPAIGR